jgi:hypothetical protein
MAAGWTVLSRSPALAEQKGITLRSDPALAMSVPTAALVDDPEGRPLSQLFKMAVLSATEQSALILGGINLLVGPEPPSGGAADPLAASRNEPATKTRPRPKRRNHDALRVRRIVG